MFTLLHPPVNRTFIATSLFFFAFFLTGLLHFNTTIATGASANQPESPPERGDTRIVIISDLNSSYGSTDYDPEVDSVVARLPGYDPDIVIIPGDMIAGQHLRLDEDDLWAMWDAFDERIAAPMRDAGIPFGFTLGNHDGSSSGSFDHERDVAADYWNRPESDPGLNFLSKEHYPYWFSYKHGDIFFATWDASSARIFEENISWLREQLTSEEAQNARYRIVLGHLPLYPLAYGRNRPGEVLNKPDRYLELFRKHGVDMYVSGHHHAYYPGKRDDIRLLSAGAVGQGPRQILGSPHPPRKAYTVLDFDWDSGDIRNTTRNPVNDERITHRELPVHLHGIQGYLVRDDQKPAQSYTALLHEPESLTPVSAASARLEGDSLMIEGCFTDPGSTLLQGPEAAVALRFGPQQIEGETIATLFPVHPDETDMQDRLPDAFGNNDSLPETFRETFAETDIAGCFEGRVRLTSHQKEMTAAGMVHIAIRTLDHPDGGIRGQLLPEGTTEPPAVALTDTVISPDEQSTDRKRNGGSESGNYSNETTGDHAPENSKNFDFEVTWDDVLHPDGFPVGFVYQISRDDTFDDILFQKHTRYENRIELNAEEILSGMDSSHTDQKNGGKYRLYHRVISTDGLHMAAGTAALLEISSGD